MCGPLKCCLLIVWFLANPGFAATFRNPIDANGQDPWVIQWRGNYYYCWSTGTGIRISRAARLQDIATEPATPIWTAPAGQSYSQNIWAP
jgi:GH43 family beta-xylosidase